MAALLEFESQARPSLGSEVTSALGAVTGHTLHSGSQGWGPQPAKLLRQSIWSTTELLWGLPKQRKRFGGGSSAPLPLPHGTSLE